MTETEKDPDKANVYVSGFGAFHDAFASSEPLEIFQWFSACAALADSSPPADKRLPKLQEFQPKKEDKMFPELDWIFGESSTVEETTWKLHKNEHDDRYFLDIKPPPQRDFWRKTYYRPVLIKDDAPFLYCTLQRDTYYTVTTSFRLCAASQYDQAGLMVRLDYDHWLKTGIELVDRKPLLSCVVTNEYSDWSTQSFPCNTTTTTCSLSSSKDVVGISVPDCRLRLHCRGTNFVVEAFLDQNWRLIRIAHLCADQGCRPDPLGKYPVLNGANPSPSEMWVGLFAACPVAQQGCSVTFTDFEIRIGSDFDHKA